MYREIAKKDDPEYDYVFYDEDDKSLVKGHTMGCSCCSMWEDVSQETIVKHIADLRKRLEEAIEIRAKYFA